MSIRITLPAKDAKKLKEKIMPSIESVQDEDFGGEEWELLATIDPGALKVLNELLEAETKGRGKVETVSFATVKEGDEVDD